MTKKTAVILCVLIAFAFSGCGGRKRGGDYSAAIQVNGTIYYSTDAAVSVEVDDSVIRYTTSYADNGVPAKDGEANFNRDTGTPYAVLEDGTVVVMMDHAWIEFKAK